MKHRLLFQNIKNFWLFTTIFLKINTQTFNLIKQLPKLSIIFFKNPKIPLWFRFRNPKHSVQFQRRALSFTILRRRRRRPQLAELRRRQRRRRRPSFEYVSLFFFRFSILWLRNPCVFRFSLSASKLKFKVLKYSVFL